MKFSEIMETEKVETFSTLREAVKNKIEREASGETVRIYRGESGIGIHNIRTGKTTPRYQYYVVPVVPVDQT